MIYYTLNQKVSLKVNIIEKREETEKIRSLENSFPPFSAVVAKRGQHGLV